MQRSRSLFAVTLATLFLAVLLVGCGGGDPEVETGWTTSDDLTILMDKVTRTLSKVINVDSAKAAKPALEDVSERLDKLADRMDDLNPSDQQKLREQAAQTIPGLKDNARRINNMQGVDQILGPLMTEIVGKMSAFL